MSGGEYARGWQDAADVVAGILAEWRETMKGDPKHEAVARGIAVELTIALERNKTPASR